MFEKFFGKSPEQEKLQQLQEELKRYRAYKKTREENIQDLPGGGDYKLSQDRSEIQNFADSIAKIKAEIRELGGEVEDLPEDGELEA